MTSGKGVKPEAGREAKLPAALAQGIGGALLEEFRYDATGEPLSVTFADYLMPTAAREITDIANCRLGGCAEPLNPLGLKVRAKVAPIRSARSSPRRSTTPFSVPAR